VLLALRPDSGRQAASVVWAWSGAFLRQEKPAELRCPLGHLFDADNIRDNYILSPEESGHSKDHLHLLEAYFLCWHGVRSAGASCGVANLVLVLEQCPRTNPRLDQSTTSLMPRRQVPVQDSCHASNVAVAFDGVAMDDENCYSKTPTFLLGFNLINGHESHPPFRYTRANSHQGGRSN